MSTLTPPAPLPASPPAPPRDSLASYWPDAPRRRPGIVAAAVAAGAVAAIVIPNRSLGLGTALVFSGVVATVLVARAAGRGTRRWYWQDTLDAAIVGLLLVTLVLRDAEWITVLCLLAALALAAVNSTKARSVVGLFATAAAVPLAALRGLPWLGRSL